MSFSRRAGVCVVCALLWVGRVVLAYCVEGLAWT